MNKLEICLLSLSKEHKIYIFLAKLKSKLKSKILDIDNVSNTQKKLLIITIMQKQNINRLCVASEITQNKLRIIKDSNISLNKSYQERCFEKSIKDKKLYIFKNLTTSRKQIYKIIDDYLS